MKIFPVVMTLIISPLIPAVCAEADDSAGPTAFASDLAFLKKHTEMLVLRNGDAAVAVAPACQGRVMTSTFDHDDGPSFGWINRPVIEKGFLSDEDRKGTLEEHIYIFGGEERFWLGPEGGQFALFFKSGTKFEFSDWTTPPVIDTEAFKVTAKSESSARFEHSCELVNFSGAKFSVGIERTVKMLAKKDAEDLLGGALGEGIQLVAYETDNRITNKGEKPYAGDVINSYNDGAPEPGAAPLGPFYELETSSPAAALEPGETMKHVQHTFHVHGSEAELNVLSKRLLGVGLEEIKSAF